MFRVHFDDFNLFIVPILITNNPFFFVIVFEAK